MATKLRINCATCDACNVSEETLQQYESIQINCSSLLVTRESKALLAKYPVQMNCADMMEVPMDVQINTVNGIAVVKNSDLVSRKTYLLVNGFLEIEPGTEKVLEQYVGITVNGKVSYPESLRNALPNMKVNGKTICYPDNAVILKSNTAIDRLFALRAKNVCYWTDGRILMVDPQLDPGVLQAKGARFRAGEALIAESLVEKMVDLMDEKTDITVIPDGVKVVVDDIRLNDIALKKYGDRLYVLGDVKVKKEDGQALNALRYLYVRGDAQVVQEWQDALLAKAEICGDVRVLKGRYIVDQPVVKVTQWLLEQEPQGIHVMDCAAVKIAPDVEKALILERLTMEDCAKVQCSPDQEDAVIAVCKDVGNISTSGSNGDEDGALQKAKDAFKSLLDTKVVNASGYIL